MPLTEGDQEPQAARAGTGDFKRNVIQEACKRHIQTDGLDKSDLEQRPGRPDDPG